MKFENVSIYNGIGFKKKLKAPTDYCFVLKVQSYVLRLSVTIVLYISARSSFSSKSWCNSYEVQKSSITVGIKKLCRYMYLKVK